MAARQNSLKNFVFSGEPEPTPTSAPSYLPLAAIARRESQPRHYFDPHKLTDSQLISEGALRSPEKDNQ